MLNSLLFCLLPKSVIDAVLSEGNLNQIRTLQRQITIIGSGRLEI